MSCVLDVNENYHALVAATTLPQLTKALNLFTTSFTKISEYSAPAPAALLNVVISKIDSIIAPNVKQDANLLIAVGDFFLWFIPHYSTDRPAWDAGRPLCWAKPEVNKLFKNILLPAMVHHLKNRGVGDETTILQFRRSGAVNPSRDAAEKVRVDNSWKSEVSIVVVRSICRFCLDDDNQTTIYGEQQVIDQVLTIGECIPDCLEAVSWIGAFCQVLCSNQIKCSKHLLKKNAELFATKRAATILMRAVQNMRNAIQQFPFSNVTGDLQNRIFMAVEVLAVQCPEKIIPLYAAESIASGQLTEFQLALLQAKTTDEVSKLNLPSNRLYATVNWKDQIECYKFSTFLLDKLDSDEIPSFTSVSWRSRSDDPLDWLNILSEKWEDMWIYRRLGKADGGWTPYVMWALAQFSQVSGSKILPPTSPGSAKVILETIAEQTDDAVIGTQTQTTTLSEFCRLISNICKKKVVSRIKYFSTEFAAKCMKEAMEKTVNEKAKLSAACEEIVALVPECGELFVAHGLVGEGYLRWASSYCVIS